MASQTEIRELSDRLLFEASQRLRSLSLSVQDHHLASCNLYSDLSKAISQYGLATVLDQLKVLVNEQLSNTSTRIEIAAPCDRPSLEKQKEVISELEEAIWLASELAIAHRSYGGDDSLGQAE